MSRGSGFRDIDSMMENQVEEQLEHEMDTGLIQGSIGIMQYGGLHDF